MAMEFSQDDSLRLLKYYQHFPILWDTKNEFYYNNAKKEMAWGDLAAVMNITKDDCRKKIESLKGSYRREKARTRRTLNSGKIYRTKWFAFKAMTFLDEKSDEKNSETPNNQENSKFASRARSSRSFQPQEGTSAPKRRRTETTESADAGVPENDCTTFGTYVANKLKNYSEQERAIAQHGISNIFFAIDMARFTRIQVPVAQPQEYIPMPPTNPSTSNQQYMDDLNFQPSSPLESSNSVTVKVQELSPLSRHSESPKPYHDYSTD